MGRGSKEQKKAYIRFLSTNLRKWSPKPGEVHYVDDDPIIEMDGLGRCVMMILGRNRERLLSQAWTYWTRNADVHHDYTQDMIAILSREVAVDDMRTELEIEVMYKWARQHGSKDPTGLAANIVQCTSRNVIVEVFQQCRLEIYQPRDVVLFQGMLPAPEDGHLTILQGSCDVINLQEGSVSAIRFVECAKRLRFEEAKKIIAQSHPLVTMHAPSGIGELSCMTGVKRHATIRAGREGAYVLVVPQSCMVKCFEARRSTATGIPGSSPSEAIELFRQLGLASKISVSDINHAANNMVKHTVSIGDCLYFKHQPANAIYLIVSGDFVADTGDPVGIDVTGKLPQDYAFLTSIQEYCFHLSSGAILGDEGAIGLESKYDATVAVASETAVIFEAKGFALSFLTERIRSMRYTALTYKELPRWSVPITFAEINNIYGCLNSLRKCIAHSRPYRGTIENPYLLPTDSHPIYVTPAQLRKRAEAEEVHKRHVARETRVALQKKRQSEKIPLSNGNEERSLYPKCTSLAMMFLKHLNITCKRLASEKLKLHARENILTDSLILTAAKKGSASAIETALAPRGGGGTGVPQTPVINAGSTAATLELRLQRGLEAYNERNRAKDVQEKEVEGPHITIAAASNMLSMLASAASSAMKKKVNDMEGLAAAAEGEGEGGGGAGGEEVDARSTAGESQKSELDPPSVTTLTSYVSLTTGEEAYQRKKDLLSRPRIMQYFHFLERSRGSDNNVVTVTINLNDVEEPHVVVEANESTDSPQQPTLRAQPKPKSSESLQHKPEVYWRPVSPSAKRPEDPILAVLKSRPAVKTTPQLNKEPLWPKPERGSPSAGTATSLESLKFNPLSYEERIRTVPSSGYGQTRLTSTAASRAQQALEESGSFERVTAPNTRRIALLPWQLVQQTQHIQLLTTSKADKADKNAKQATPTAAAGLEDGDEEKSTASLPAVPEPLDIAQSFDISEPAQFLKLLQDKDFPVRSKYRPKNVWRTRTMKVTQNSTEVEEEGSAWFRREVAARGLTDVNVPTRRRYEAKGSRGGSSPVPVNSPGHSTARSAAQSLHGDGDALSRSEHDNRSQHSAQHASDARRDDEEHEHNGHLDEVQDEEHDSGEGEEDKEMEGEGAGRGISAHPDSLDTWESVEASAVGEGTAEAAGDPEPVSSTTSAATAGDDVAAKEKNVSRANSIAAEAASNCHAEEKALLTVLKPAESTEAPAAIAPIRSPSRNTMRTPVAFVPEPSALKEPSKGLRAFKDVLEMQYTSRRFLDGRRRHDSSTKFQLDPPAFAGVDDNLEARRALAIANKAATEHLLQALLPPGVTLKPYGAVKKSEKKKSVMQTLADKTLLSQLDGLSRPSSATQAAPSDRDRDLEGWKGFSVGVSVHTKYGPHASLPVLAGVSTDPAEPRIKKSSLNFCNRLAHLPGNEESRPTEPESYLAVYQAQFTKKKKASRLY